MITIIRKPEEVYKEAYEKLKFKHECYELLIDKSQEKVKKLEEENDAYKILLKNKLNKEEK